MFSSLLVVVILGAVTAQITRWCLVGAQPATVGLSSHRAGGGVLHPLVGAGAEAGADATPSPVVIEDHPVVAWAEPVDEVGPLEVDLLEVDLPEIDPLQIGEAAPQLVVETTATSWLSRARALVGLTVVVSALGAVLAVAVASTALLTAAVLDSALG